MKTTVALVASLTVALAGCYAPNAGDLFSPGEEYACAVSLDPYPNAEHATAIRVGLDVPDAPALVSLRAAIHAKPGHLMLPASMPAFAFGAVHPDGWIEILGMARDASETVEAYEAPHDLELDLTGVEVPALPVVALSYPEHGEGAIGGGALLSWRCVTE